MKTEEVNVCGAGDGKCCMNSGNHNHGCGCGNEMFTNGCGGHRHYMLKRVLVILILLGIFWLGTAVGQLRSMKRSGHSRSYRMMDSYGGEYGNMMWYGTESGPSTLISPQMKQESVTTKTTTPTKK